MLKSLIKWTVQSALHTQGFKSMLGWIFGCEPTDTEHTSSPAHSALTPLLFLDWQAPGPLHLLCLHLKCSSHRLCQSPLPHSFSEIPLVSKPFLPTHPLPPLPTLFPILFFSLNLTIIWDTVTFFICLFDISPNKNVGSKGVGTFCFVH